MNQKIWNLYKQSEEYRRYVDLFNPESGDYIATVEGILNLAKELGDDNTIERMVARYRVVEENFFGQGYEFVDEFSREDYEGFIDEFKLMEYHFDEDGSIFFEDCDSSINRSQDYRLLCRFMQEFSTFLYLHHAFFKPILISTRFSILQKNCEQLGIDLPSYPKSHDYKAALMWYYDICTVFNKFQEQHGMTDSEFCSCLYGLAAILTDEEKKKALPKPINVWLTGASKNDIKYLNNNTVNESLWTCNENTRRGDIVIIYALAPYSCIHSIWRADSEATFNPFDDYQHRTRVTDGVILSHPVSLKDLKADPEFGKLPMLNNNLQGVNGKHIPSWAYTALLKMIAAKGEDTSKIPVLFETKDWNPGKMLNEHDVEERILIPFLHDLGYEDSDWSRQLRMKSGRKGNREIPDFVFFPYGEKQFENAPFMIEAKWLMKSEKDRNDAYRQALSYARMLLSPIFGICDEERLIIFQQQKDGSFNYNSPSFEAHWAQIAGDEETHNELMLLIGADVIKSKIGK